MHSQSYILLLAVYILGSVQGDITRPWLRRPHSQNQYQFNDGENSWEYARERCMAQGADLTSINDDQEKKWVLAHYPTGAASNERKIIIGLFKHPTTNAWVYTDDKEMDAELLPWSGKNFRDSEQCGYLSGNTGAVDSVLCEGRTIALPAARYVCERTPEQTANVISPLASQLPADLIKQLKRIAKAKEDEINQKAGISQSGEESVESEPVADEKTTTENMVKVETTTGKMDKGV